MGTRVLLLEPDASLAAELQAALRHSGYTVTVVREGRAGLARAVSQSFDFVLVSAELPGMNGFRLCNRLKKDDNVRDVPVIIMGAAPAELEAHGRLATRAETYLERPVRIDELVTSLRNLVRVRESARWLVAKDIEVDVTDDSALVAGAGAEKSPGAATLLDEVESAQDQRSLLEELQARLTRHEAATEALTRELAEARAAGMQAQSLAKEVDRLRRELASAKRPPPPPAATELADLKAKNAEKDRNLATLRTQLAAAEKASTDAAAARTEAETRARNLERTIHQREARIGQLEMAQSGLSKEKHIAEARVADFTKRSEERAAEIKSLRSELETERKARASDASTHAQALAEEQRRARHEARPDPAREDREAEIAALRTEHEWETAALSALLEQERAEIARLKSAAVDARHDQELTARVKELEDALARARAANDAERRYRLVEDAENADREAALEAQLATQAEEIKRLSAELEADRAEVPELEAEIVVLRGELTTLRRQVEQQNVAARAAAEQLERERELLARAHGLLAEMKKSDGSSS